jgi:lipopolysaccharide export system protein LptC
MNYSALSLQTLLLVALLGTGSLIWHLSNPPVNKSSNNEKNKDAFVIDLKLIQYSILGTPQYTLTSPYVEHFSYKKMTVMSKPTLLSYNTVGTPWQITAHQGTAYNKYQHIQLVDAVKIYREASKDNKETTLLTDEADYYPKQHIAKTQKPVTMKQPGAIVHAIGMHVNTQSNTINLLHDIHGSYIPGSNHPPTENP